MKYTQKDTQKECDKLNYALSLIDALAEQENEPRVILKNALKIMAFGDLTSKQILDYIDAIE